MKILVSGSTGLVGSSLIRHLGSKGHSIVSLVRHAPTNPSQIRWNPPEKGPLPEQLEGIDAVVHLAGESIASGRWTAAKKKAIYDSRILGTRLLSDALAAMKNPPKVLVSASAIGFYGDRGNELLKEDSAPGQGFLPDVCKAWEASTAAASAKGVRVVHARFGIILSPAGGALKQMLIPFKMGVGGNLGSGTQYMSWIALDDVVDALQFAISMDVCRGSINVVSPHPATNAEYTKTLGRVLGRPTIFPMPAFAARLAFGEMADALLLASTRVTPSALENAGFNFKWPELEGALRHLLNK